jgi:hypothetical protein
MFELFVSENKNTIHTRFSFYLVIITVKKEEAADNRDRWQDLYLAA